MASVESELARARQSLLDLTMRNRLLNYRPSKVRSIRIVGEVPAEVYDSLVINSRMLEMRGTGSPKGARTPESEERGVISSRVEEWRAHAADDLQDHHTDRYLQTPYDDESLAKRLFKVYHEGLSVLEEQGYTIVFLALGFLEWFEDDNSSQARRAPLILIPVELQRIRAGDFSRVKWTEEEVFANISLAAKLVEQGITLPPFEAPQQKDGIDGWFQRVADLIARKPRWRILSEMALDFFSFTKFVMFKDLDPATWPAEKKPADHALLKSLFLPSSDPSGERGFDEREIDEKLTARDLWHVMDADPSQIAVIEDVKGGKNLVVQGPPGTGKSQTIANLIGEALALGKTVLFVSEKMAALEVVKSRLDRAGLGPFCLEIHSRKANKKAFLLELQTALQSTPKREVPSQHFEEHKLVRDELNRFAQELREPVGAMGLSPYQLLSKRMESLAKLGGPVLTPALFSNALLITKEQATSAELAVRQLADALSMVQPLKEHPWRCSRITAMLPHEEQEIEQSIRDVISKLERITEYGRDLAEKSGVQEPRNFAGIERATTAAELLSGAAAPTEAALLLSEDWNGPNPEADDLLERVERLQEERRELAGRFTSLALTGDHARAVEEFAPHAEKWFRIFIARYRALRKELGGLWSSKPPSTETMVLELRRLVGYQKAREELRRDPRGQGLFGIRWQRDESDVASLREFARWLNAFRTALLAEALTQQSVKIASSRIDSEAIQTAISSLRSAEADGLSSLEALLQRVEIDPAAEFGADLRSAEFDLVLSRLAKWSQTTSGLFRWAQFNSARRSVEQTIATALIPAIDEGRVEPETLQPLFNWTLAESLLREAFAGRPALAQFSGEIHEKKIARFRQLDSDLVHLNQVRLSRFLHEKRPFISGGASRTSEAGILMGEFNRKRGHMSIRKLLANCGSLIQRIKPCFLMSPLSVAQFLDPRSTRFDLIVFDEASQVRPEDAVGALLRGDQLVVMGDTQQLPPTSFFDHLAADDVEEGEEDKAEGASIGDVESILHQCARSFPSKTLNWHYRSRHESLIAISNLHFYENRLRIYPSAMAEAEELGLHFHHLPEGVYDRGKSSTNRIEARAIAEAALQHYRQHPSRSLGIGTFNIKQQQTIQEEIEVQLQGHPEMEEFFRSDREEHFFVKNLETIQGDERDVIFISTGYGKDATGKLSLNFGPLNREGGERRLNVLISRAREKCVVYSNFTARDLPLETTESKGLFALKAFLEFAETRRLTLENQPLDDYDSVFEEAVANVLRERGYDVRQQVGCAGFRVDLGVIDPDEPGRYVVGIECDGAKYHSSPVARDRDRLRQQVLENLGWRIYRVWSTDWYRNRKETIDRLIDSIERAKASVPSQSHAGQPPSRDDAVHLGDLELNFDESATMTADLQLDSDPGNGTAPFYEPSAEPLFDVPDYFVCSIIPIPLVGELHEVLPNTMATAVAAVVRVEGPVHVSEVVRRIREFWGLGRAGTRIRTAVEAGVQEAVSRRKIVRNGDFLTVPGAPVPVRRRTANPPPKIDLISEAEIAEAVKRVLRVQFGTPLEDLAITTSRMLGFLSTSEGTATRIRSVIRSMIGSELVLNGDRIELASKP